MTNRDRSYVIRASGLKRYEILMAALGIDPVPMLLSHGIDPLSLNYSDMVVSLFAFLELLEDSAAASQCPDFGLRLADTQYAGSLGLLSLIIQNAPTVAQAITDASSYTFLHCPAYEVILEEQSTLFDECSVLRFAIHLPEHFQQRQTLEACIGSIYRLAPILVGENTSIHGISLPHEPIAPKDIYYKFFNLPVYFSQPYAGLHIHKDILKAPLKSINPTIRQIALDYITQNFPPPLLSFSEQVKQILTQTIGINKGTRNEVAKLLGLHPRTMQRRLKEEQLTFEEIREEVYRNAAIRYLRETNIPLKQLAGVLGFSEQSALSRACERWFNKTPLQIRNKSFDE